MRNVKKRMVLRALAAVLALSTFGVSSVMANTVVSGDSANTGTSTATAGNRGTAVGESAKAYHQATAVGDTANAAGDYSIAIGFSSTANSTNDISIGYGANSKGLISTAFGVVAGAYTNYSLAIGRAATVGVDGTTDSGGVGGIAIGNTTKDKESAKVTGDYGIAIGSNASVTGMYGLAVGVDAAASYEGATAIGAGAKAYASSASAFGRGSHAYTQYSLAMGWTATVGTEGTMDSGGVAGIAIGSKTATHSGATVLGDNGIAIGSGSRTVGVSSISMGIASSANSSRDVAIGFSAYSDGDSSLAIGDSANANTNYSLAIGKGAAVGVKGTLTSGGVGGIAIGSVTTTSTAASATSDFAIAVGSGSAASGQASVAIGFASKSIGNYSTAVGYITKAGAFRTGAFGYYSKAYTNYSLAMGSGAQVGNEGNVTSNGYAGIAIGSATDKVSAPVVAGDYGIAIGTGANVASPSTSYTANYSIAIGYSAKAQNFQATALGYNAIATGQYATALGRCAEASAYSTLAIGDAARAYDLNAIAIGYSAHSTAASSVSLGYTARTYIKSSLAIGYQAQVGSATTEETTDGDGKKTTTTTYGTNDGIGGIAIGSYVDATYSNPIVSANYGIAMGTKAIVNSGAYSSIAIGFLSSTGGGPTDDYWGQYAMAFGTTAKAVGNFTVALGYGSHAYTYRSVAIGAGAEVGSATTTNGVTTYGTNDGRGSIAIGSGIDLLLGAKVQSNYSIAMGAGSSVATDAYHSIAIGIQAQVSSATNTSSSYAKGYAIALGDGAKATAGYATAIGQGTTASGYSSIAVGENASASGNSSAAFGYLAKAYGGGSLALGLSTLAGTSTIAATTNTYATAIGTSSAAYSDNSIALGRNAIVGAYNSSSGSVTANTGVGGIAIGSYDGTNVSPRVYANYGIAMGTKSSVAQGATNAVAIGYGATASGADVIALGDSAKVYGKGSMALGLSATAGASSIAATTDTHATAIGTSSAAYSNYSVALGRMATVGILSNGSVTANTGVGGIAIGSNDGTNAAPFVYADYGIAIGTKSSVAKGAPNSVAVGSGAKVEAAGTYGVALGDSADVKHSSSVALGKGSVTSKADSVSVGASTSSTRTITNVTNATSTKEAANYDQIIRKGQNLSLGTTAAKIASNNDGDYVTLTVDGSGAIASGNTGLLTGGTAFTYLSPAENGNYIRKGNDSSDAKTTAQNLVALDTKIGAASTKNTAIYAAADTVETQISKVAGKLINTASAAVSSGKDATQKVTLTDYNGETKIFEIAGQGSVLSGDKRLISGGTLYTETRPVTSTNYIATTNTTAANLSNLDTKIGAAATKNTAIYAAADTVETQISKVAGKLINTASAAVSSGKDATQKVTLTDYNGETKTFEVAGQGEVQSGDKRLVNGGTVYEALNTVKENTDGLIKLSGDNKQILIGSGTAAANATSVSIAYGNTNRTLTGVGYSNQSHDAAAFGQLIASVSDATSNADKTIAQKSTISFNDASLTKLTFNVAGEGAVLSEDKRLISGGTLYTETRPVTSTNYIATANTTAANLSELDKKIGAAQGLTGVYDKTDTVETQISKVAGKLINTASAAVSSGKDATQQVTLTDYNGETKIFEIAGQGSVLSGDKRLISGGTLYTETRPVTSTNYIATTNTTAANLSKLDEKIGAASTKNTAIYAAADTVETQISKVAGKVINTVTADTSTGKTDAQKVTFTDYNGETKTIEITGQGAVESGDVRLVNGGTVYDALQQAKVDRDGLIKLSDDQKQILIGSGTAAAGATSVSIAYGSTDRTLTGVAYSDQNHDAAAYGQLIKTVSDATSSGNRLVDQTSTISFNDNSLGTLTFKVAGEGEVLSGDKRLISGGTLYTETRPAAGNYISDQATKTNLTALDSAIGKVETDGKYITQSLNEDGTLKTSVAANLSALDTKIGTAQGLTGVYDAADDVETQIYKTAQKTIQSVTNATSDGTATKVQTATLTFYDNSTKTIEVAGEGAVANGDVRLISGETLYGENRLAIAKSDAVKYHISDQSAAANLLALDSYLGKVEDGSPENADTSKHTYRAISSENTVSANLQALDTAMDEAKKDTEGLIKLSDDKKQILIGSGTAAAGATSVSIAYGNTNRKLTGVEAGKENTDAANVGQLLKKATHTLDSDHASQVLETNAEEDGPTVAISVGSITSDSNGFIDGKTVYAYNKPAAQDGYTLTNVEETASTGVNLGKLDAALVDQQRLIASSGTNIVIAGDATLDSADTVTVSTSKGATRKISGVTYGMDKNDAAAYGQIAALGQSFELTSANTSGEIKTNDTKSTIATISIKNGIVKENDTGFTSGDTVYKALKQAKEDTDALIKLDGNQIIIGGGVTADTVSVENRRIVKLADGTDNTDAATFGQLLKAGTYAVTSADATNAQSVTIGSNNGNAKNAITITVAGDGQVAAGDQRLVSGDTVNQAFETRVGTMTDGTYISKDKNVAGNLSALDKAIKDVSDKATKDVSEIKSAITVTEDGNYIAKDKTAAENITALDDAIGTVANDGNVIEKSLDENGALKTTVSQNLEKIDAKIGTIAKADSEGQEIKYQAIKADNSISDNLVALDHALTHTLVPDVDHLKDITQSETATATGTNAVALGDKSNAEGADSISFGTSAAASGENAVSIGNGAQAKAKNTVSIGTSAAASGENSISIGNGSTVSGTDSIAVGTGHTVHGNNSGAFGDPSEIHANNSYAFGNSNTIGNHEEKDGSVGNNSFIVGNNSTVTGDNTFVLGNNVTTSAKDSVILGNGSTATEDGVVSVGAAGSERKIVNVADGVNDTDAVNVSQLKNSFNSLREGLTSDINKVGAGAAALAALRPETFNPDDKWSFAVGYGHYKNANAGAFGAFYKPNADVTVSLSSTIGNGDPMMNAGVSFKFGKQGKAAGVYRSNTELVRVLNELSHDNVKLKNENTSQAKKLDVQAQKLDAQAKEIGALKADNAKIKADNEKMKAMMSEILKKMEMSEKVSKSVRK